LERQTRQHVLHRIRAGALEAGTVELLRAVDLGERMDREGHPHDGSAIVWEGRQRFFMDTKKHTGKRMMAYGQTAITEDLYAARDAAGGQVINEARNVRQHDLTSSRPSVTYEKNGQVHQLECDYVAGCDRYHGVSRESIPTSLLRTFEKDLSVRLAGHHVEDAATRRFYLLPAQPRIRDGIDAQPDAEPLLHSVRPE
jgi:p-hydroxybenzoate 3-monooxygenase